ncbi:MAG: DEAD/DEAH box helicase, partial [Gammaproteobacteria bacterium]
MPVDSFHPSVAAWFARRFVQPTDVQREAWPAIREGKNVLLAAPTGSGKTLAAFLSAIDSLVREGLERGLPDETRVLYVSPLKALSHDIQKNLQEPLTGIRDELLMQGQPDVDVRAWVRTGDTPQHERARARRQPPHILVTTPESLYILLTSESGRRMLSTVREVIVDEIHAVAGNKRGAHLSLSLERLEALCERRLMRIGLSATQKPIENMARFLLGDRSDDCTIIDTGHDRERDLAIVVPSSPLEAVMAIEVWDELYEKLTRLVEEHNTTLIFVNTRRLAERVARHLAERIGEEHVTSHHGSLARKHRLYAEQRLKAGQLRALVATASLELGIDIGDVDLVCQLGSPRSISAFLQRVGRSGHSVDKTPKGRLFPLSRDDLVESVALFDAARRGELDRIHIPDRPRDVLAQQIVAEVANREWDENELFNTLRRAWPYRELQRLEFDDIVNMLAQGFATRRGRRGAYLHHDAVNGRLRGRRNARLVSIMNGGAIPDQFDYDVVLSPSGLSIGTLNEDFAFESLPGDIFQLGNTSYRILRVQQGKVHVEDAKGQPPNIPFWVGEAPGRSDELSQAVSRLRAELDERLDTGLDAAVAWLRDDLSVEPAAAQQLAEYAASAKAALGLLPTRERIVFERFFDEAGDMHLVIHAPYGSRVNRAWGLALRKRFCRKFNFELQAAALEDSIVLSLGATHSFPLEEVRSYLHSASARDVLIQALLDAPMFATRWRWVTTTALAVQRNRNGKRVPAQFQRTDSEDLMALVFPDGLACIENVAGAREIPDHPLVNQTIDDCLHEVMDVDGCLALLKRLENNEIEVLTRDLTGPSPLSQEIIGARPYAFLDDAPAEERRTLAVQARRFTDPGDAAELSRLDPEAIKRVREEVWPLSRTADELHDALCWLGFMTEREALDRRTTDELPEQAFGIHHLLDELIETRRATVLEVSGGGRLWVAAERLAELEALIPNAKPKPAIDAFVRGQRPQREGALVEILRSRLEGSGPVTAQALGEPLALSKTDTESVLLKLEGDGFAVRGQFDPGAGEQWCERRLLARIHRYTIRRLRSEIEAVSPADFMKFLVRWHHLDEPAEGAEALGAVVRQLEGFQASAVSWESELLPARMRLYHGGMLDALCATGEIAWLRLGVPMAHAESRAAPVRSTPISLVDREAVGIWREFAQNGGAAKPGSTAQRVTEFLEQNGASFFSELKSGTALLPTQLEEALGELVALGKVTSDSFAGLRALITPSNRRPALDRQRRRPGVPAVDRAGRWALLRTNKKTEAPSADEQFEQLCCVARALLRRYGIVFRRLLERESNLPPWRELLYALRRMEARGEIRGGRYVDGFSGEQFALPEAIGALRAARKRESTGDIVVISAADPLNLAGIVTPGEKVPAIAANRVLLRDGLPIAA